MIFGERLFKALVWDEFSQTQIERMLEACRVVRFTRSSRIFVGMSRSRWSHLKTQYRLRVTTWVK